MPSFCFSVLGGAEEYGKQQQSGMVGKATVGIAKKPDPIPASCDSAYPATGSGGVYVFYAISPARHRTPRDSVHRALSSIVRDGCSQTCVSLPDQERYGANGLSTQP